MKLFQLAKQHGMSSVELISLFPTSMNLTYLTEVNAGLRETILTCLNWHSNMNTRLDKLRATHVGYTAFRDFQFRYASSKTFAEFWSECRTPWMIWFASQILSKDEIGKILFSIFGPDLNEFYGYIVQFESLKTHDLEEFDLDLPLEAAMHAYLSAFHEEEYWDYFVLACDFKECKPTQILEVIPASMIQIKLSEITV